MGKFACFYYFSKKHRGLKNLILIKLKAKVLFNIFFKQISFIDPLQRMGIVLVIVYKLMGCNKLSLFADDIKPRAQG
jgi:hypothetical protein